MDYKKKYLRLKKKYKLLKKNGGSINYIDISQKSSFESTILNNYNTALSYINVMSVNKMHRIWADVL